MKSKPVKKKARNLGRSPVSARPKGGRSWSRVKFVCVGIDSSYYGISLGGIAKTRDGKIRAGAVALRWTKDVDYFTRMKQANDMKSLMHQLFAELRVEPELDQVWISIEEAAAISHTQKGASQVIKQQIQISGAIIGGILSWGWPNLWEIQAQQWQKLVAADLGLVNKDGEPSTHHTVWNPTKKEGKFRAKEWIQQFHPKWDGHWPDIIRHSKLGMIPRPDSSTARGEQSDDRYEALAIAHFQRQELKNG